MDTLEVLQVFGKPSLINKKKEWEYRTGNSFDHGEYNGNGMRLHFYENGTLSYIEYIMDVPIFDPQSISK